LILLHPAALATLLALVLVWQSVVQSFGEYLSVGLLEPLDDS
jgi:hypothetical protein